LWWSICAGKQAAHAFFQKASEGGAVAQGEAGGRDGFADADLDVAGQDAGVAGRKDVAGAGDGHRDGLGAGGDGEPGRALLERAEGAVAAAAAFGKNQNRERMFAKQAGGLVQALDGGAHGAAVDGEVAGAAQVPADEGHAEQLPLGEEPEGHGHGVEHDGRVGQREVVGDDDVAAARREAAGAGDADARAEDGQHGAGPQAVEAGLPGAGGRPRGGGDSERDENRGDDAGGRDGPQP